MINIKKVRPLFTKIVTTCNKYDEDQKTGSLIDTRKQAGAVKEYQTVVAVGSNPAGIKVGDVVMINPMRYAVMKHESGSVKDGVIKDNPVVGYQLPVIELNGVPHLLLETADVEFVIEDYEENTPTVEEKAAKAGLYTPGSKIIS